MANIIEIIRTVSSLVPSYDGRQDKLVNVLSALNACKALINDNTKDAAIQTILSKLEGKARAAVIETPESIDEIIKNLKTKCSSTTSPNTLLAKLNATKQREHFSKFVDEIERLTLDLEKVYLEEKVPLDTASKLATNAGVKALINGIKNEETKLLLKAGQFDTLSKAIERASENEAEKPSSSSANVYQYTKKNDYRTNHGRGSSRQTYNYQYQNNRRNSQSYRGNSQTRGNFQSNRGGYSRFNQRNHRGRGYNNNFNPGPSGRGRNVYYMISENPQVPQQPVGGQQTIPAATQQQPQQQQQLQKTLANMQRQR